MIDIYLIRHGQTGGNLAKRHQLEETHITPEGKDQARKVGAFVKTLNLTRMIASSHVRTLETAGFITEGTDCIPESNPIFMELIRPDAIYGYRHKSSRSMWYLMKWYFGFAGDDGSVKEGESYQAFRQRIEDAQNLLTQSPDGARVAVVSHSVFISFLVAHMCDTTPVSFFQARKLFKNMLKLRNGSVTHVQYDKNAAEGVCPWQLVAYNQHAHLDT
ncbi:MAG: alpha-ribazole phosphatase [Patiriisocius sp.]|jgi:alpha-ribazole phosphatase